jgi:primosomal protein N''
LDQLIEELKQKVSAKMQQLARYRKRQNQYYQNKLFRTDCKKFCKCLRQAHSNVKNAPNKEEVKNFWLEIWGEKVQHNEESTGSKTSINNIQASNGAQSVKKTSQRH